ncbi:MAG: sigma 54-interacting transcriptional regulator [Nannocystaceae bacterium]
MRGLETLDASEAEGGPSTPAPMPGVLLVWSATGPVFQAVAVGDGELVLGREPGGAGLAVDDTLVSRRHCGVRHSAGTWTIRDLGSRNGTFVDGIQRDSIAIVGDGVVRIGHCIFLRCADLHQVAGGVAREGEALVGPRLRRAWAQIAEIARFSPTILITGESGTGKELAARHFHRAGKGGPFIAVNCATIPEGVAERLLFGTRRGAYSGANQDAAGYVQAADGGTLFLDEFGELELAVQAKLLRLLEDRTIIPLGATRPQEVDVRVCVATNRDLRAAAADGAFREDLYFRVAEPSVTLPPLRERREEIPALIQDALDVVHGGLFPHSALVEACLVRPWPGNVRQLRSSIRAAAQRAILASRALVGVIDLSEEAGLPLVGASSSDPPAAEGEAPEGGPGRLSDYEPAKILAALRDADGNVSRAARALGVHRNQLRRWLAKTPGAAMTPAQPLADDP